MKRCQETYCYKIANPGFIYCTKHLHKAMTENKNEWETCQTFAAVDPAFVEQGPVIMVPRQDGYEYRLQRRKKEKAMPELMRGDGIQSEWHTGVYMGTVDYDTKYSINTLSGINRVIRPEEVINVMRAGQEIWRREG